MLKFWKVKKTFFRGLTQNRENSRLTTFYVEVGFYQAVLMLCLIFTSEVNTVLSIFIHALRKFAIFSLFQGNIPFATSPVRFIFTHFQALRWAFAIISWPHRGAKFAAFRTKNFRCPKLKGEGTLRIDWAIKVSVYTPWARFCEVYKWWAQRSAWLPF